MPKGEALPSAPAAQSTPVLPVPSSKLGLYLPGWKLSQQLLGSWIKPSDSSLCLPVLGCQQTQGWKDYMGWGEIEGLVWLTCKLVSTLNHTLIRFWNPLPLTCCRFANYFCKTVSLWVSGPGNFFFYSTAYRAGLRLVKLHCWQVWISCFHLAKHIVLCK